MQNSEMYAVKWQSSTVVELLSFVGKGIAEISKAKILGILGYMNLAFTIYTTFR